MEQLSDNAPAVSGFSLPKLLSLFNDGVILLDTEKNQILFANEPLCTMLNYEINSLANQDDSSIFPDNSGYDKTKLLSSDQNVALEWQLHTKNKTPIEVIIKTTSIELENKQMILLVIKNMDQEKAQKKKIISLEKTADELEQDLEKYLQKANQMTLETELANIELKQIFNTASDGMWIIDSEHNIRRINKTMLKILKIKEDEALSGKCNTICANILCDSNNCPLEEIKKSGKYEERDIEFNSGHYIVNASAFKGLTGEIIGVVITLKDITLRKQYEKELQIANQKLSNLALVDKLTGIPNRRSFDIHLEEEWRLHKRNQESLALIMCDVDHFKLYNDNYGHQQGDVCLHQIAQALKRCARRPGDMTARYGGEEFAVILHKTDIDGALCVARNILQSIRDLKIEHAHSSAAPYATFSLGVSAMVPDHNNANNLIQRADVALYTAKENGRNRAAYIGKK